MTARLRASAVLALMAGGVCMSLTIGDPESAQDKSAQESNPVEFSALDPAHFSIEFRRGQVLLKGFTSSVAHEQALALLAAEKFDTTDIHLDFKPLVVPPTAWSQVTLSLVAAVATTRAADATASEQRIQLRGITDDSSAWAASLDSLRAASADDVLVDAEVVVLEPLPAVAELCQRVFSRVGSESVNFRQSSANIRTSSHATLDAIVSIAYDCSETSIAITGHSDASGYEMHNQHLSLQRAQAVADYLASRGVSHDRLLVTGVGSSLPIADNSSASGRNLNRRIEFKMLPAETQAASPNIS